MNSNHKLIKIFSSTPGVWEIMEPIIRAGETYSLDMDLSEEGAFDYWFALGNTAYGVFEGRNLLGICYMRTNRPGNANHIANAGFMVHEEARGKGVAKAMCQFIIDEAKRQKYEAVQYNFVVSSNTAAVNLWQKMGFQIIGRTPNGFKHPTLGSVDSLMMWRMV